MWKLRTGTSHTALRLGYCLMQAKASWYKATATHLASWGYVVMQYNLPGLFPIVLDRIELTYFQVCAEAWYQRCSTAAPC
jgi:hypothetical protein